jgi:hypothetical protein
MNVAASPRTSGGDDLDADFQHVRQKSAIHIVASACDRPSVGGPPIDPAPDVVESQESASKTFLSKGSLRLTHHV